MSADRQRDGQSLATQLIHAGDRQPRPAGEVAPPIHPSTTFRRGDDYELIGDYVYARYGSPTSRLVEELARELDGGVDSLVFSSGLAAFVAFFETVPTGGHIIAPQIMYHGGQDWLRRISSRRGIELTLFDASDPAALATALQPGRDSVVWLETPTNPTWDVVDIAAAAETAHAAGAVIAVDSTVAPPVTTRPLAHGADFVFHSATKYFNGHSDVLAGLLTTARDDERWAELRGIRKHQGSVLAAFESWLLLRGMRTLALRFERASASALRIATALEGHPSVERVLYPGLQGHPTHDVARRQMTNGFGGMLSLLVDGSAEESRNIATRTRLFAPATSLGGIESLIEHRASVEGPLSLVPPNLLRLSVGIEDANDLLADLIQALEAK